MILSHLLLTEPSAFEPTYMPAVIGALLLLARSLGCMQFGDALVLTVLRISMVHAILTYAGRAYVVIQQVARYLDINCLSIKKHEQKRL